MRVGDDQVIEKPEVDAPMGPMDALAVQPSRNSPTNGWKVE